MNHPLLLNCGLARANWFFHRAFSPSASTTVLVVHDTPHLRTELTSAERTRLATLRSRLIEASHMVIGLSEGAIAGITGAHYVGHGCDEIWGDAKVDDATEPADLRAIPHPRAIYLGSLSARVHVEALEALATSGVHVVVVGFRPNAAIQHLFDTHENVHFLGSRTPAESAAYLLHSDVGIVPHTDEPFTRSMEPHKVYNYACAGLRTVMLNGGAPRRLQTLVVPTMTVVDFVDATWSAVRAGRITSDQIEASRALTWARVTREILDLVPVTPSSGWIAPQPPTRSS